MTATLKIYTMSHCPGFAEARRMRREIARRFPRLCVELIDLDMPGVHVPPEVFSVPTYLLNGDIVSLGNPYLDHLDQCIRSSLNG